MTRGLAIAGSIAAVLSVSAAASEIEGPARFCGYSPIIDLLPGEHIETRSGGIHSGSFRWTGDFGSLDVNGIGWGSKPEGQIALKRNARGHVRFAERRADGGYVVAIWNGAQGAAYFSSARPITATQLAAIDRVDLFNEGEAPEGCNLRTIFSWE